MTRRAFLAIPAAVAIPAAAIAGNSPRNGLCEAANEFHAPYVRWAERMNASSGKPLTIAADVVEAFQPLPNLWRRVERKFRAWVTGR